MDTANLSNYNQQNKYLAHSNDYKAYEISDTKRMSFVEFITTNFRVNIHQYNCGRNIIARLTLISKYPQLLQPQSSITLNRIINTVHNRQCRIKWNVHSLCSRSYRWPAEFILIFCTICVLFLLSIRICPDSLTRQYTPHLITIFQLVFIELQAWSTINTS
jgi:hypothetical protein